MAAIRGQSVFSTLSQALLPVLAETKGSNPLLLLPKQVGGLGLWCPKTGYPLNAAMGSFQKLHTLNPSLFLMVPAVLPYKN